MTADRVTISDDGPWLRATVMLPGCPAERALAGRWPGPSTGKGGRTSCLGWPLG